MNTKKLFKTAFLIMLISVLIIPTALAGVFHADETVRVNKKDLIDDVYVAGSSIHVDKKVYGDLHAAGANIYIDADVTGDVYAAGSSVTINGQIDGDLIVFSSTLNLTGVVADDVKVATGQSNINAQIGGDVIIAAGMLDITQNTVIGGDLVVGSGQLTMLGDVKGDVIGGFEKITLGGSVDGNMKIKFTETIAFMNGADVNGNLFYKASAEVDLPVGLVDGKIEYKELKNKFISYNKGHLFAGMFAIFASLVLYSFLSHSFAAFIILLFVPGMLAASTKHMKKRFGKSVGLGFLGLILFPVIAAVLVATVVGWKLLTLLIMLLLVMLTISALVAGNWIGRLIYKKKKLKRKLPRGKLLWREFGVTVLGLFLMHLVLLIPFVGWIVYLVLVITAFGALLITQKERYKVLSENGLA